MYKIIISPKARKAIKKIPKQYQYEIILALRELREDPLGGKPLLRELTGRLSVRISNYRIIYKINHQDRVVRVISAGHRETVYS